MAVQTLHPAAGAIYKDWDADQLAATMADVLDDDRPTDNEANPKSFLLNSRKRLQFARVYRQRDSKSHRMSLDPQR